MRDRGGGGGGEGGRGVHVDYTQEALLLRG